MNLSNAASSLMAKIAGLHDIPQGAHSIRKNGKTISQTSTEHIIITPKDDKDGLDIVISSECQGESLHIPVVIEDEDMSETVYNTFKVGGGADVTIVAGCGLHNDGKGLSRHDGIHELFIGRWAKVRYVENHYASGAQEAQKTLNPQTTLYIGHDATVTMELVQLGGVNSARRKTTVYLEENAKLIVSERLFTEQLQTVESDIIIELKGAGSSAQIVSRSVAKEHSRQSYMFEIIGNSASRGYIACDAIIMDDAAVSSHPAVTANHSGANLIHEAAIGRIESKQLIKLMSLGATQKEAEDMIIDGFLK
jgi:Fe-S cluster assembly scaffold protein SufB